MTKEEALKIEIEFLKSGCYDHVEFSKLKGKGEFWYLNLGKKYNLRVNNKHIIKRDKTTVKNKIDVSALKEVVIKNKHKREPKEENKQNPLLWNFREKISKLKGE